MADPNRSTVAAKPDPTLGPCAGCGVPLDGARRCSVCGQKVPDPRVGTTVLDRYRIDGVLGEGGMGIVYAATHAALGEPVAIKFLHASWSAWPEFRARFRREAVILARLRHPGIVSVLDFGELDGELYMVMERISGDSLAGRLRQDGKPMPRLTLGHVFDQLLEVVEAAHDAGVVHRDLKPENVMLVATKDREERVKVLDFGIAYLEEEGAARLTETGTVRGTPQYMAPEQCRGQAVGPPADVYATGVMLFEAITGALPFEAHEVSGLLVQHMFLDPPKLRDSGVKPDVSPGLEDLVRRTLAKAPDQRPTARALREELTSVLRGTDFLAFADRGAGERTRAAALSRSDRAITGLRADAPAQGAGPLGIANTVAAAIGEDGQVRRDAAEGAIVVWSPDPRGAGDLRAALAVHGHGARAAAGDDLPDATGSRVLVIDGANALARTARAKAAAFASVPVLVVGASASETAALVRAGASDVALAGASGEEIARKAHRLLRRGR